MLRTALKPRWLGLLGVVILIGIAFVQLGRWQLGVAHDDATRAAIDKARAQGVADVERVIRPHQNFPGIESGRQVRATGEFLPGQVLVADRRLNGRTGLWVVAPFRVASTGGTLAILRGFVTDPAAATAPPTGQRAIVGGLAPGESPYAGSAPLPSGQLGSVDLSLLVNQWPGDLYNAFVFAASETPPDTATGLEKVPTPTGEGSLNWRNAAYAVQWWVFAAFALWMWWRMVKEAERKTREEKGENGARD